MVCTVQVQVSAYNVVCSVAVFYRVMWCDVLFAACFFLYIISDPSSEMYSQIQHTNTIILLTSSHIIYNEYYVH